MTIYKNTPVLKLLPLHSISKLRITLFYFDICTIDELADFHTLNNEHNLLRKYNKYIPHTTEAIYIKFIS